MTASTESTAAHTATQALAPRTSQHLAALALAAVTTLAVLSSMTGLADGYRAELQLAQSQAASQPMAAAAARKAPRG